VSSLQGWALTLRSVMSEHAGIIMPISHHGAYAVFLAKPHAAATHTRVLLDRRGHASLGLQRHQSSGKVYASLAKARLLSMKAVAVTAGLAAYARASSHNGKLSSMSSWRVVAASKKKAGEIDGEPNSSIQAQLHLILIYVSFQAIMNLYMKFITSTIFIAPGLSGIPAPFLVTGLQQLVALILFLLAMKARRIPVFKRPSWTWREYALIFSLSVAFSLNMGFNNLSMAFIPLSVHQVIRACMPLATAVLQKLVGRNLDASPLEWFVMLAGVCCAMGSVFAKVEGQLALGGSFIFGACVCFCSVFCGAIDLVLKQAVKADLQLSPMSAMGYMAFPTFVLLTLPGCFWQHPAPPAWVSQLSITATLTDLDIAAKALELRPAVLGFAALSGILAFGYNTYTTYLAGRLSATTTSLAGNFPTTVLISLFVLERQFPSGIWGIVFWTCIGGNISSFVAYNYIKQRRLARKNRMGS